MDDSQGVTGLQAVEIELDWQSTPALVVEQVGSTFRVTADLGLSEPQVRQACQSLGPAGERIYREWRARVGLD